MLVRAPVSPARFGSLTTSTAPIRLGFIQRKDSLALVLFEWASNQAALHRFQQFPATREVPDVYRLCCGVHAYGLSAVPGFCLECEII